MNNPDIALLTTEAHGVTRSNSRSNSWSNSRSFMRYILNSVTPCLPRANLWLSKLCDHKVINFLLLFCLSFFSNCCFLSGQVKVRIYANQTPESVLFSVTGGKYQIDSFNGKNEIIKEGEMAIISKYNGKLVVKIISKTGFICDSVIFLGLTGNDSFALRTNGQAPVRQFYNGDLKCFPDLGTLVFVNISDIESYIAGVVKTEGGSGKNIEYLKTQAIIARTYMYKYFNKHASDFYNLCDNTHCQAFNGITKDTLITRATYSTSGQVILAPDSTLIISAFHSNCGGETSPSENVWLTEQIYLKRVIDPYCIKSRNAIWQKKLSINDWTAYLKKMGYNGSYGDSSLLNFSQRSRSNNYRVGNFSLPLSQIRMDLNLRSTFFFVTVAGDSVVFDGRGYGHGVGLCQEGAMEMADKGYDFKKIIGFYYPGVIISDIKNALTK